MTLRKFIMLFVVVLGLLNLGNVFGKVHRHPTPTYFHRKNPDGSMTNRADSSFEDVFRTKFLDEISPEDNSGLVIVDPSQDVDNGAKITVSWKYISKPTVKDWIGFYCPRDDLAARALDYFFVSDSEEETWQQGYGSRTVAVFNLRSDCEFRYYRYLERGRYTALVARSNQLTFKGGADLPMHGHLSLTNDPSQMRVMWISGTDNEASVRFGVSESELFNKVLAKTNTYKASDMCGPPANTVGFRDPGFIHDALITDLKPSTRYFYSFGSEMMMSPVYNSTSALPAGDATPHKFIVYGDMGIDRVLSPDGKETANRMVEEYRENSIRHVFHNGDISYAMGHAYLWDQWMAAIQPYSTLVPYMVGIGNHEQDHLLGASKDPSGAGGGYHPKWGNFGTDSGGECGVPMFHRFHMPDNGNHLWWYSYDYGLVHFIMMSTENNFEPGSRQYKWLENDLKNVDRKKTPWVLIGGHRAMYDSQDEYDDYLVSVNMQRLFEDLLYKYQVDLALWAHYHSYERTCKVYRNKCVEDGVTHIVVGTAGRALDLEYWMHKEWSVKKLKEYGYGRMTVFNRTAMLFEFVSNEDREVKDSFYLLK